MHSSEVEKNSGLKCIGLILNELNIKIYIIIYIYIFFLNDKVIIYGGAEHSPNKKKFHS